MVYGNKFLSSNSVQVIEANNAELVNDFFVEHINALQEFCGISSPEVIQEGLSGEESEIVKRYSYEFKDSCKAIREYIKKGDKAKASAEITKAKKSLKEIEKKVDDVDEGLIAMFIHNYFSNIKMCFHMLLPTIGVRVSQAKGGVAGVATGIVEMLGYSISLPVKSLLIGYSNFINIFDTIMKERKKEEQGKDARYIKVFSTAKSNAKTLIREMSIVLDTLQKEVNKL